jgi:phosphoribosylaminoimidazolecarboxamide formyltransferase/IMP cyclohydrolase
MGGLLVNQFDEPYIEPDMRTVSKRQPTEDELNALAFSWRAVKCVKSNAILIAHKDYAVGIGGGLSSRVDAAILAVRKAGDRAKGAVSASDAFMPFPDTVSVLASAGVTAIIQPGGSRNDEDAIKAVNQHNMAMVFTGMRHFKH